MSGLILPTGLYQIKCFVRKEYGGHVCVDYKLPIPQPVHFKKDVNLSQMFHRNQFYIEREGDGKDVYRQRFTVSNEGSPIGTAEGKVSLRPKGEPNTERWRFLGNKLKDGRIVWRIYDDKFNHQWAAAESNSGIILKKLSRGKPPDNVNTYFEIVGRGESKVALELVQNNYKLAQIRRSHQILVAAQERRDRELALAKEQQDRELDEFVRHALVMRISSGK